MITRHLLFALPLLAASLLPTRASHAQGNPLPYDDALPEADVPHAMDLAQLDLATPLPLGQRTPAPDRAPAPRAKGNAATTPNVASEPPLPPATSAAAATASVPATPGSIRLNFQNAPLNDVLNYLSAAAGFIITQDVPVTGTVNVVSQQSMNAEEAVDLLNTILAAKGYVALRNGRILKIVSSQGAQTLDLPVITGSDPANIPRKDSMVTQILPVHFVEVGKLVDNLRPLLSEKATITSNETSNAIILTDTQTNIHRMAEIIHALDNSISSISQIKVFGLRFSDAKGLADIITQLFAPDKANNQPQGFPGFLGFGGFGGQGGRNGRGGNRGGQQQGGAPAEPESAAREAASRVIAVADETSNSVIVSAPDEIMSSVAEVIAKLDTSTNDITETQIFHLLHADATELATVLSALYADASSVPNANNRGGNNGFNRFQPQPQNNANRSDRALAQARVVAVADARTNSVLVSASHDTMSQIALTVGRLDHDGSKKQHVRVYTLGHADPDNVATILRGMYSVTASNTTASQPSTSRLTNRTTTGASTDVSDTLNTSGSRSGGGALNR